jgi:uncharacterized membrane protein YeaQ/YmgE (transglycosylase-associated protein family)
MIGASKPGGPYGGAEVIEEESIAEEGIEVTVRGVPVVRGVCSMDSTSLIVSLLSGAAGGNLAGAVLKNKSLGPLGNSIVGILGGGLGGSVLGAVGASGSGIVGQIAGGGVGGAILLLVIGFLKGMFSKAA